MKEKIWKAQRGLAALAAAFVALAASAAEEPAAVDAAKAGAAKEASPAAEAAARSVTITSDRSTYLRKEGVIAFEGHVFIDDPQYKMHADEVNLFLEGTNEVKRVVAVGNVTVTDGRRSGSCAKATYSKALSRIVLYGDAERGILARLEDAGRRKSEVCGRKIVFWIDTEQVEVEGSTVTVDASGIDAKRGVKRAVGK